MSGLGGLNKSPHGVVIGLVQLQLPVVETPLQLQQQAERIVAMVGKARRNNAGLDLVVFPEYALHGLSMNTDPALMCQLDGPEVASFQSACKDHRVWGCFSIMELNPDGSDGSFDSMGEAMFCNFDGTVMTAGGGRPDEIITAELRPDLVREARAGWGVENNPYQLYHRGYVAVKGGAQDCPYTYMTDMAAGRYKLPWDAQIQVRDGTPCGFPAPTRRYRGAEPNPVE